MAQAAPSKSVEISEIIMEINEFHKRFSTLAAIHFRQGFRAMTTADTSRRPLCLRLCQLFDHDHKRQKLTVRFEPQSGDFWFGSLARTALPEILYHILMGLQVRSKLLTGPGAPISFWEPIGRSVTTKSAVA